MSQRDVPSLLRVQLQKTVQRQTNTPAKRTSQTAGLQGSALFIRCCTRVTTTLLALAKPRRVYSTSLCAGLCWAALSLRKIARDAYNLARRSMAACGRLRARRS